VRAPHWERTRGFWLGFELAAAAVLARDGLDLVSSSQPPQLHHPPGATRGRQGPAGAFAPEGLRELADLLWVQRPSAFPSPWVRQVMAVR